MEKERKVNYNQKGKITVYLFLLSCVEKDLEKDRYHFQQYYKMSRNLRIGPNNINLHYS